MPRGTSRASRRQRRALVEAASLAVMELDLTNDLLRAQRIEVVGQMAGGIAHDFNNLLTVILGHAALLATTLPESDDRHYDVAAITEAAERAARVAWQLLTASAGYPWTEGPVPRR